MTSLEKTLVSSGIEYVDLKTDDPKVIGLKATGTVRSEALNDFIERVEEIRASGNKARVYVNLEDYDGFESAVAAEKFAHLDTLWNGIERCAYVVGTDNWMSKMVGLVDVVTPMNLRAFELDEDAEARDWLLS